MGDAGNIASPFLFGLIAQWIEHPPSKRAVAGSNPAQSVLFFPCYMDTIDNIDVMDIMDTMDVTD